MKTRSESAKCRLASCCGFLIILVITLSSAVARGSCDSLDDLLERWKARDGVAGIEVGHELSEYFVSHPREFLESMNRNQEAWAPWLERLPVHTLTAFREGAEVDCEVLRQNMIAAAEPMVDDPTLSQMADKLLGVLRSTMVRSIE